MKRLATTAAVILFAAPAFALVDFEGADVDGDGFLSLPEAMAAYPGLDPTDYSRMDKDNNRMLDFSEANTGAATSTFNGLERAEAVATSDDAMAEIMLMDMDQDNTISYDEMEQSVPGVPQVYFQDFDLDNNGVLSSEEMNNGAFINLLNKYRT